MATEDLGHFKGEFLRLDGGPSSDDGPSGIGLQKLVVRCTPSSHDVLSRIKGVVRVANRIALEDSPDSDRWTNELPSWFIGRCAAEMTSAEEEAYLNHWRSLSGLEKYDAEKNQPWSLGQWTFWMLPTNRQWFWWDSRFLSQDELELIVAILDWPVAIGALGWLIRSAGGEIQNDATGF